MENKVQSSAENVQAAMKTEHLSFAYGEHPVLKDVTLDIQAGKVTTILGANGCGKTTLFSLMTKNLIPAGGRILLGDREIRDIHLSEFARRAAMVHQHNTAAADTTVEQLVAFGRTPYHHLFSAGSSEDQYYVERAMDVTNITRYRQTEVSRLSGGQRQRVWIAMALAQNTKILFLDEPTTYLDIRYQAEILQLVTKLNQEYDMTIIMVLHDINQALHYSDYVIGLKDGRTAAEGRPEDVITPAAVRELYDITLPVVYIDGRKYVLTA